MSKFHFGKKKCVTKKLWNLAKKRNLNKTKKGIAQFKKLRSFNLKREKIFCFV